MMRLRPKRSPRDPQSNNSPARTSTYASTTHCSPPVEAPRSIEIRGSAVFTMVSSRNTMIVPTDITARTHQRRSETFATCIAYLRSLDVRLDRRCQLSYEV